LHQDLCAGVEGWHWQLAKRALRRDTFSAVTHKSQTNATTTNDATAPLWEVVR